MGSSAYHAELTASCPDGWQVVPLPEVAFFQEGPGILAKDFVDEGVPLIRLKGVEGDFVTLEGCNYLDPHKVAVKWDYFKLNDGDLVISTSASFGRVSEVGEEAEGAVPYTGLIRFRPNSSNLDKSYLKAFLGSAAFMQQVEAMASGSVIRHFGPTHLKQMALHLPPLSEQRAIGEISDLLANRLRLLRNANATLESIAQALFKSWFVDFDPVRAKAEGREPEGMDAATAALFPNEFEDSELGPIPKGWYVDGLGKISENIRNQARPENLHPDTAYIGLEHMPRKSIALTESGTAEGLASGKFWYATNDILFGKLRPYFHKVGLAPGSGVCSTDILVIRPVSQKWLGYAAMQFSSDAVVSYATQLSNGAKMPRTNWNDLAKYRVALPSEAIAEAFNDIVRSLIERIHASIGSARTLADLRDTLLPRLISGKLRLPEAERDIEAATA